MGDNRMLNAMDGPRGPSSMLRGRRSARVKMSSAGEERVSIDTYTSTTTVHTLAGHRPPPPAPPRPGRRPRRLRFMKRDGRFQVVFRDERGSWSPYLLDIYTTLVETRWRLMLLLFSLSYILSWLLFALLYWLMAYAHGDLAPPPDGGGGGPCVANVRSFTAAFLFSMETQATIGYGFRGVTENCPAAVAAVTAQSLLSCLVDTVVIGVVVAKMASARPRALTVGFSRCAVVNLRDGALCLSWRLGDFRGKCVVEGVARAQVVRYVTRPSGAVEVSYRDLELLDRDVVLATPATVVHRLGPGSPLYRWRPEGKGEEVEVLREEEEEVEEVEEGEFELVVSFTYTGDTTGTLHQARTSYAVGDIRWGQRFQDMLRQGPKGLRADYALFNQTSWVPVPRLSAEQLLRGAAPGPTEGPRDPRGGTGKTQRPRGPRPDPGQGVVQEARL
ncbi:unnamed protein product [Gadus morhua 'NCC']